MPKYLKNTLYYCGGIILVAVLMQILSTAIDKEIFVPSVNTILGDFFNLLKDKNTYLYLANTLKHLIIALIISFLIGGFLGIAAGILKPIYMILKPLMSMLRILPIIMFIVILMAIFSVNRPNEIVIILCSLVIIPIIYEGFYQGIANIDSTMLDVYKMNSSLNLKVLFNVHLPLIVSYVVGAFINAIGLGIKVLVTTEYIVGANNTIGQAIILEKNNLNYSYIYAYSIILIILVIVIELLPRFIVYLVKKYKSSSAPLKNN